VLRRDRRAASVLTAVELGSAFGRERIVHAAVAGGKLCDRLALDLARLAGLRAAAVEQRLDREMESAPVRPAQQNGGTEAHD
jgi:hypothetical protein